MLLNYIAIGLGGAIGSIFRAWLSKFFPNNLFNVPLQIMMVNIIGCFVMGALTEITKLYWVSNHNLKSFLITGVLGGFTTFSTFALEYGTLVQKNLTTQAILYLMFSVGLSLLGFFLGIKVTQSI